MKLISRTGTSMVVAVAMASLLGLGACKKVQARKGAGENNQAPVAQNEQYQGQPRNNQADARAAGANARARAGGTIVRSKDVGFKNSDVVHRVVLLDTGPNQRVVVDLGPKDGLGDVVLTPGAALSVDGVIARVGDRAVLFADRFIADDKMVVVTRTKAVPQGQASKQAGQTKTISGKVIKTRDVKIKKQNKNVQVALVQTDKGRQLAVDLGPKDQLQKLGGVKQNESITAQGRVKRIGDRMVLLADSVSEGGQTIQIDRSEMDMGQKRKGAVRDLEQKGGSQGGTNGNGTQRK